MRKMIKLAFGLAALGFVGLIGLSTMSMLWAIAAPHPRHHPVAEEMPPLAVAVAPDQPAIADDVWPVDTSTQWGAPAQENVNYAPYLYPHLSWFEVFVRSAATFLVLVMVLFIILRFARPRRITPSDESALIHELARRAQDLSQRMEALETILLDRSGHYRETAGRS